jgi:hypothetical protein
LAEALLELAIEVDAVEELVARMVATPFRESTYHIRNSTISEVCLSCSALNASHLNFLDISWCSIIFLH